LKTLDIEKIEIYCSLFYGKNDFVEIFKNVVRAENNFIEPSK